ncbi:hypothetical protein [Sorangium sp. So ce385]|uniref:hypothetical protein n=1 Tax=Sorangium sp. So ce385 TaxID=3133308 RepID=UPI003F5BC53E
MDPRAARPWRPRGGLCRAPINQRGTRLFQVSAAAPIAALDVVRRRLSWRERPAIAESGQDIEDLLRHLLACAPADLTLHGRARLFVQAQPKGRNTGRGAKAGNERIRYPDEQEDLSDSSGARPASYTYLRMESTKRLAGGWWSLHAVPDHLVSRLPNVKGMTPQTWVRQRSKHVFPAWVEDWFRKT